MSKIKVRRLVRYLRTMAGKLFTNLGIVNDAAAMKVRVSKDISSILGGKVAYGPLKGFQFAPDSRWSLPDRAAMLLGLYEKEVLDFIYQKSASANRTTFIDIGAADGYYAVGCVSQGLFVKSYCFEIDGKGRSIIRKTAILNGVQDKVIIFRAADEVALSSIPNVVLGCSIVLIDIEGAELEFLNEHVIDLLSRSIVIIEIHDFFREIDRVKFERLREKLERKFSVLEVRTGKRDLSDIPEVEKLMDHQRWLICSESRRELGKWWLLEPREDLEK